MLIQIIKMRAIILTIITTSIATTTTAMKIKMVIIE